MKAVLVILLFLICVALCIVFIISLSYSIIGMVRGRAPFVPVRRSVLPSIVQALALAPGSILYDLGCGDGRVLRAAVAAEPRARGIGIEVNWLVSTIARIKTRKLSVAIKRSDLYTEDLSNATHIFCYLYASMLPRIEERIYAQCKPGTRIVTCDFMFPSLSLLETISLEAARYQTCKTLYVYIR